MTSLPVRATLLTLGLMTALPPAAAGQEPTAVLDPCDGRRVSEVVITTRDPSFLAVPRSLRPLARGVGLHHTTSKPQVIGHFLLLEEGAPCTERQREESERILRLQPFLADASVRTLDDGEGGVRVVVDTVDEIPTVFAMRVRGGAPSTLRAGNGNVAGQGLHLAGAVERGFAYRTGFRLEAMAYQAFRRPYTASLVAERAPLGSTLSLALGRPFLTDLQRTGWHLGFSEGTRFLGFVPPEGDPLSLEVRRRFRDLGAVRRIGIGRNTGFVGALVTSEAVTSGSRFVMVTDSGLVTEGSGVPGASPPPYRNLRVNAVVGVRALSFTPVRGFDALTAVQDVATGVQVGMLVGRGWPGSEARDDDRLLVADLYAGHGSASAFWALRVEGEARSDPGTGRWDSMVGSGRLAGYLKPWASHVVMGSAEFGGAHRTRVPFQLRLGDHQGGVRGYGGSRRSGAVRGVVRLEERWIVGDLPRLASFGLAGFTDGGWVWAGDAPFGADSGVKVGVGAGLLAAFPTGSPRLWKMEVAVPVSSDPHARWEVRLTGIRARHFWTEPDDVNRARAGAAPSTIFGWP
jgi:hypothetical protein